MVAQYRAAPMPRLLLHLGLAKTATSSLQRNVLAPAHAAGRIHVPRCGPRGDELYHLIERLRKRRLAAARLDVLRATLDGMLDGARLNVISDERIPGSPDAEAALWNLRALCRNAVVRVLVCLRSPVDLAFLAFVGRYEADSSRRAAAFQTFDAFVKRKIEGGGRRDLFQDAYLRMVVRFFPDVEVLLYEDLQHDRPHWLSRLAGCLELGPAETDRLFSAAPRNVAVRTRSGIVARPVIVGRLVTWLAGHAGPLYARWRPGLQRCEGPLLRMLAPIGLAIEHPYPDAAMRRRLQELLGLRDDYLTRTHGVSAAKLARYGYLHPSWENRGAGGAAGA